LSQPENKQFLSCQACGLVHYTDYANLLNLLFGASNFEKIWFACKQYEIQYTQ